MSLLLPAKSIQETVPCDDASNGNQRACGRITHMTAPPRAERHFFSIHYEHAGSSERFAPPPPPPTLTRRRPGYAGLPVVRTVRLHIRLSNADCDVTVTEEAPPWRNLEFLEERGHILLRRHLYPHLVYGLWFSMVYGSWFTWYMVYDLVWFMVHVFGFRVQGFRFMI